MIDLSSNILFLQIISQTEKKMYCYKYPRPLLTVDAVVFKKNRQHYEVLLIERKFPPYKGKWALPGGFVDMDENLDNAIKRELEEETNIKNINLKQLYTFGDLNRDPRGRTVSVVYWGVAEKNIITLAGDDAAKTKWFHLNSLPDLAFDHNKIIEKALICLSEK
jgi:8-oxo-dGTP diphosphatase